MLSVLTDIPGRHDRHGGVAVPIRRAGLQGRPGVPVRADPEWRGRTPPASASPPQAQRELRAAPKGEVQWPAAVPELRPGPASAEPQSRAPSKNKKSKSIFVFDKILHLPVPEIGVLTNFLSCSPQRSFGTGNISHVYSQQNPNPRLPRPWSPWQGEPLPYSSPCHLAQADPASRDPASRVKIQ